MYYRGANAVITVWLLDIELIKRLNGVLCLSLYGARGWLFLIFESPFFSVKASCCTSQFTQEKLSVQHLSTTEKL